MRRMPACTRTQDRNHKEFCGIVNFYQQEQEWGAFAHLTPHQFLFPSSYSYPLHQYGFPVPCNNHIFDHALLLLTSLPLNSVGSNREMAASAFSVFFDISLSK